MKLTTYYLVGKGVKQHTYLTPAKRWTTHRHNALHLSTETDARRLCTGRKGAFVIMAPYLERRDSA